MTALREELTGRVDDQLAGLGVQARRQIAAGRTELFFRVPADHDQGVRIPDPYIFESLAANGSLQDSRPAPLPADAPELSGAGLAGTGPFTVRALTGSTRWRVLVR